ncbi:4'-phosphopantetheinyl transferase family protein [Microvirga calopogonii]|uniref:4'-phosphopantetheinyl transferase family protein n=1 Tax=Microvirga calopogonii TaxID=2078013 RepID=UPI001FE08558|nr:4'-phosphopantetheinyl transferase superfamily protein [Microvirga calopogonii]
MEVLVLGLDAEPEVISTVAGCLAEDERRRAERFASERDRRRFIATRGQLRHILAARLEIAPSDVEFEYAPQGKPHLSRRMAAGDLHFSVSRSEDAAVIALSNTREVGVDIEAVRPIPEADHIAALCFSASEYGSYCALPTEARPAGFFQRWTRLEAISKAIGCGLAQHIPLNEQDWTVHTFIPNPGYIGAVVVQKRLEDPHDGRGTEHPGAPRWPCGKGR